ncbi:MAG: DsrE family protein [Thioalkalispiraceae bacterium]|jgi:predicted peroxiredoxin
MADKLLIILMNTDPTHYAEISAPLFQAVVAASMEYEVEIVLTGRAGNLARQGFAAQTFPQQEQETSMSVYDLVKEAHEAGVKFTICSPALEGYDGELIAEIEETVGSAYVISQAMTEGTITFTY